MITARQTAGSVGRHCTLVVPVWQERSGQRHTRTHAWNSEKKYSSHEHTMHHYILFIHSFIISIHGCICTFQALSIWTAALPWLNRFIAETTILSREVVLLANFAAMKWRAVLRIVWKAERWPQPGGNNACKKRCSIRYIVDLSN